MDKRQILKEMRTFYGNNNLNLPEKMDFHIDEETGICKMMLDSKAVREENMQKNCNSFEGWSIAIYTALREKYGNLTVSLDIKDISDKPSLHWTRFLYRVERFCRQYKWFCLSKNMPDTIVTEIELFQKGQYINNVPEYKAGIKADHNKENVIEACLAEGKTLKEVINNKDIFDGEEVYRQFPVGLFKERVNKSNSVFPGGKSAIDLWSYKDDTFYVVELKALNPMIGIITEIFFYANYMYDLLVEKTFLLNEEISRKSKAGDRGYRNLLNHTMSHAIKQVNGIMLADQYHPILEKKTDKILEVMNDNGDVNIQYYKTDYQYVLTVLPK